MTSNQTPSSAASAASSKNTPAKFSAPKITVQAGDTISVQVAKVENHPPGGVLVNLPGNPRGFIPTRLLAGKNAAAKEERRDFLTASPGFNLHVLVVKAHVAKAQVEDGKVIKPERVRIILNEDRVTYTRLVAARQEAEAVMKGKMAMLNPGAWMMAQVTSLAVVKGNGKAFGAFVELENGVPALLHNSEMVVPVTVGESIYVAIRALKVEGDVTKVSVTQKAKDVSDASAPPAGTKCSGMLQAAASVATVDGWPVQIDGVAKAFLPLSEVGDLAVAKQVGVLLDVTIMPFVVGDHVRVTRRKEVIDALSALV